MPLVQKLASELWEVRSSVSAVLDTYQEMERHNLTKTDMAFKRKTRRASLNRLLDPSNASVSLQTLERAALAVGQKLKIQLV